MKPARQLRRANLPNPHLKMMPPWLADYKKRCMLVVRTTCELLSPGRQKTLVGPGADGYGDFDPLAQFRMRQAGRSSSSNTRYIINDFSTNRSSLSCRVVQAYSTSVTRLSGKRALIMRLQHNEALWLEPPEVPETSSKSTLLAEMYRPPFDLMSRLPWDAAREEGRQNERMVAHQHPRPSIFDCQVLNRDL